MFPKIDSCMCRCGPLTWTNVTNSAVEHVETIKRCDHTIQYSFAIRRGLCLIWISYFILTRTDDCNQCCVHLAPFVHMESPRLTVWMRLTATHLMNLKFSRSMCGQCGSQRRSLITFGGIARGAPSANDNWYVCLWYLRKRTCASFMLLATAIWTTTMPTEIDGVNLLLKFSINFD